MFRLLLVAVLTLLGVRLHGEHLPIKSYSSADGLPHDEVERIVPDSRGFLWFCTRAGLSRFDGYAFVNFGPEQGLPEGRVSDLLETRTHEYWVATDGGLLRFDPAGRPMFVLIPSPVDDRFTRTITVLREGRDGTLWVGTRRGLYRLAGHGDTCALHAVDIGLLHGTIENSEIADIQEDRFHTVWITAPGGLYRRWPDGSSARYSDGLLGTLLTRLTEDREGRFWVGTRDAGFFGFVADATHTTPTIGPVFGTTDGLPNVWVTQIFEASDGRLWIADVQGLVEFFPDQTMRASRFHVYSQRNGLTHYFVRSISEDQAGNLWLATEHAGAMKVVRGGFMTYGRFDGLSTVNAIVEDRAGNLCFRGHVLGDEHSTVLEGGTLDLLGPEPQLHTRLGCFDGARFSAFVPEDVKDFGWVLERTTLQARNGEFWIGTGEGVFRYAATDRFSDLKTARPRAVHRMRGLAASQVYRLFQDKRGDIWIAVTSELTNGLARWDAASDRIVDVSRAPRLPPPREQIATSFGEDRTGNVWIGFSNGLARYAHGAFAFFAAKDGLPPGAILDIHEDRAGRLWLATDRAGLLRVDHAETDHPVFVRYADAEGRPSTNTMVIVEDSAGFLYFGGGQGIDRLDPATGHVKHFTAADGLTPGLVQVGYQDRHGVLWFGLTTGLARLEPPREVPVAPAALISAVRVNGAPHVVSALGERSLVLADLAPNESHLEIDFLALAFGAGEVLRYQYQLEGTGSNWSAPSVQRTVNFANLAAGSYTFLVRAINSDGLVSSSPASIRFVILRPIWLRWWFLSLAAVSAAALLLSVHRYRMKRVLELAAIRNGIATDLHDDIGANLTRISMLSEVAKRGVDATALTAIDGIARESVSAMSDIVWAINPERESLGDLIRRMRAHGEEMFTRREIDFRFTAPGAHDTLRLGVDTRRDLLLIFKEAVNNTARHSQCSSVIVELQHTAAGLALSVADNGVGFDTSRESTGQGLASLRRRAARLGGTIDVQSAPSRGTIVTLLVPLRRAAYQGR